MRSLIVICVAVVGTAAGFGNGGLKKRLPPATACRLLESTYPALTMFGNETAYATENESRLAPVPEQASFHVG
jgi:hypothetical protein